MSHIPRQPLSLPVKILVLISNNLEQGDLTDCVLVCRTWNKAFTPTLFSHIHVNQSCYHAFTSSESLQRVASNARCIRSIDVPHPTFARPLLEAVAADPDRTEPWFPNLRSVSIAFDQDIHRSLKVPVPQPQFLYPSDLEDLSDEDLSDDNFEDSDDENTHKSSTLVTEDPTKGVYSALLAPCFRSHDTAYITQDPYDVFRLLRQCPALRNLKIQVTALSKSGGLGYLLQPDLLPQSLERLEIIVPYNWREESYDNSEDEDYDPALNPARDIAEEYEEDEDHDMNDESDNGYDENAVVEWYHTELKRPKMANFWNGEPPPPKNSAPRLNHPLLNLRELAITNAEEIRRYIIDFVVTRCPHLRSIHMVDPSDHLCESFFHGHMQLPPELAELRVEIKNWDHFYGGEYMSCVLSCAEWRIIVIRDFYQFEDSCTEIILEKALSIE
ncbi:hypothetical protein BGZ50_000462, partial [Haplosporangium sp. Z 11]